jgi:DNA-binding NtrC family response regulator
VLHADVQGVAADEAPCTGSGSGGDAGRATLVGSSWVMRELQARIDRVATSDATVLIEGETGTGKELVARALHDRSARARGPFITVDCGSLAQTLLEAELFGHARGAFTDAHAARPGAIEAAQGGTVFLDEIGELPLDMQPRLLRVLEARAVKRIGENQYRPVDVRFVFATHRNLGKLVAAHGFREDLFFRLAVLRLRVPPLRERRQDIPALVERLLPPAARHLLTPALLDELASRAWTGNVRELRNVLERLAVLGPREGLVVEEQRTPITRVELEPDAPTDESPSAPLAGSDATAELMAALPAEWSSLPYTKFRACALENLQRAYVAQLLARHHRRITAAAAAAEIDRTHLHRLIRRYGL